MMIAVVKVGSDGKLISQVLKRRIFEVRRFIVCGRFIETRLR
jgi:hypothetical protein